MITLQTAMCQTHRFYANIDTLLNPKMPGHWVIGAKDKQEHEAFVALWIKQFGSGGDVMVIREEGVPDLDAVHPPAKPNLPHQPKPKRNAFALYKEEHLIDPPNTILFQERVRVQEEWNKMDPITKLAYQAKAEADHERYKREIAQWRSVYPTEAALQDEYDGLYKEYKQKINTLP